MKIGMFLSKTHNIEGRVYKESVTLTENNYKVIILALEDKNLAREEIIGGAMVKRCINLPKIKIPIVKQSLFLWRCVQQGLKLDVDVYHAYNADMLVPAAICAKLKKKKLVYDSRELYLNIPGLEQKKLIRFYWKMKELWGIKQTDYVIACNEERGDILKKRYSLAKDPIILENYPSLKIGLIYNFEKQRAKMREKLGIPADSFVFVFQGTLNENRGLEEIKKAMKYSKKAKEFLFLIIGDGSYKKEFEKEIKRLGYNNFIFTGSVHYKELPYYLTACDVGIVFYPPICLNYYFAASNKLYEYMLSHLAILASNLPTLKKIVCQEQNGVLVGSGNSRQFGEVIDYLIENRGQVNKMKKRSYLSAIDKYNWEKQENKILKIYENI